VQNRDKFQVPQNAICWQTFAGVSKTNFWGGYRSWIC